MQTATLSEDQIDVLHKGYRGLVVLLAEMTHILKDVKDENDRFAILKAIKSNAQDFLPGFASSTIVEKGWLAFNEGNRKYPKYFADQATSFVDEVIAEAKAELSDTLVTERGIQYPEHINTTSL